LSASLYVDPSIIAGLVLGDIEFPPLRAAIPEDAQLVYGTFGFGEAVSAIAARTRATHGNDADAAARVAHLRQYLSGWNYTGWVPTDLHRAITFTTRASLALKFPDAIHIAIAERLGLPLLTSDRQQHRAASTLGLASVLAAISG